MVVPERPELFERTEIIGQRLAPVGEILIFSCFARLREAYHFDRAFDGNSATLEFKAFNFV
jgi:hypothetical protein